MANTFIKGYHSASRMGISLDHAMDGEQELKKLHIQMEDIFKFINSELIDCFTAFEQIVLLCEELTTLNKQSLVEEIQNFVSDDDYSIEDPLRLQQEQNGKIVYSEVVKT